MTTGTAAPPAATSQSTGARLQGDLFYTARDGLKLYARHYPAPHSSRRPLVCLPGITRNSRDFHTIASALSGDAPDARPVYALDLRGRGRSEYDPTGKSYTVGAEMIDVLDFLTFRSLSGAAILGTSRGGLIAMVMASAEPAAIGAVILNDIGPVIEIDGLSRIAGYVGRTPVPHSWADAARIVRDLNARQFTRVTEAGWMELARQFFDEVDGRPVPAYDAKLAGSISALSGPPPAIWPQFEALKHVPAMVLRGENSDLLSAATVEEMRRRHPRITAHTVRWEGHAPLLKDEATIETIAGFLVSAD